MRFQGCSLLNSKLRVHKRRPQHHLLCMAAWCCQARAPPILSDRAPKRTDRAPGLVVVGQLAHECVDSLATSIPVCPSIKGVRSALDRREARNRIAAHHRGIEHHIHASAQRMLALKALQCAQVGVIGNERRRARRVERGARTVQAKHKRDAAARD